ncbi:MAG: biotin synthase BioB [Chlamydiae bacterium]|nr:biotin synthase BioB [Chlamydiota bacterium]MBI3277235.1 biotin synthase BioB [Chlamydiota bacterium]
MNYLELSERVLKGKSITRDEARNVLQAPAKDFEKVLEAVLPVREHFHGRRVKLCLLQNTRSGLCPEDCHYCSQSVISKAPIEKYGLLPQKTLLEAADKAVKSGAKRFCMVTSGRGPSDRDIDHLVEVVGAVKEKYPTLEICCSLGLMDLPKAKRLKESGVGWVNHNLNTSERFYPEICKTHTYEDRLNTLQAVKAAGLSTCSGGIIGMGETDEDILDLAFTVRDIDIDSIPLNFLHPIDGTPLNGAKFLDPVKGILALCVFRFLNPEKEVRAAGGREFNLKELQRFVIYPANSIFVEGYLTTPGQQAIEARQMIEGMGFEVEESKEFKHGSK